MTEEARNRPFPRDPFKRVVRLYADYKWTLAVVGLLVLVTSTLGVITPLLIQRVIDDALPQQDMNLLLWLIAGMVVVAGVAGGINFIQSRLNRHCSQPPFQRYPRRRGIGCDVDSFLGTHDRCGLHDAHFRLPFTISRYSKAQTN